MPLCQVSALLHLAQNADVSTFFSSFLKVGHLANYLPSMARTSLIINSQHLPVPRIAISGNPSANVVRLSILFLPVCVLAQVLD